MSRQDIETHEARWLQSFNGGDASGVTRLYEENGRVLPPNNDIVQGRPAIEAFVKEFLQMDPTMSFSLLVLITTFVGYLLATPHPIDWLQLINATLGTALAAAGAAELKSMAVIFCPLAAMTMCPPYPPMPQPFGTATPAISAAATTASMALPPSARTLLPTSAALIWPFTSPCDLAASGAAAKTSRREFNVALAIGWGLLAFTTATFGAMFQTFFGPKVLKEPKKVIRASEPVDKAPTSSVIIRSYPPGAEVYVDGTAVGTNAR